MNRILKTPERVSRGTLSVLIVDDLQITEINNRIFEKNTVTDVISLQYEPLPGEDNLFSGEVFVNIQRAVEQSSAYLKWSPSKEFALYIAHGCDHLAGAEDSTEAGKKQMRRREIRWLKEAEKDKLIENLLQ